MKLIKIKDLFAVFSLIINLLTLVLMLNLFIMALTPIL